MPQPGHPQGAERPQQQNPNRQKSREEKDLGCSNLSILRGLRELSEQSLNSQKSKENKIFGVSRLETEQGHQSHNSSNLSIPRELRDHPENNPNQKSREKKRSGVLGFQPGHPQGAVGPQQQNPNSQKSRENKRTGVLQLEHPQGAVGSSRE